MTISEFDELKLFTNISKLENQVLAYSSIEKITLPSQVTALDRTFDSCSNLKHVTGLEHVTKLENRVFTDCKNWIDILNMPMLKSVTNHTMMFCNVGLKGVESLGSITELPSFQGSQIEYINIPETVTELLLRVLAYCEKLTKVRIPKNVRIINNLVFSYSKITELIFEEGAEPLEIGAQILRNCPITTIVFPARLTKLAADVLGYADSISKAVFKSIEPPILTGILGGNNTYTLYVPDGSLNAYKTATNWSNYASRIKPLSDFQE